MSATLAAGRVLLSHACGDSDILVNNNAGPPPGRFEDWDEAAWTGAINANMLPALMLIRGHPARYAGAQVRPHRECHQRHGEIAAGADGSFDGGSHGVNCGLQGARARSRGRQRDDHHFFAERSHARTW